LSAKKKCKGESKPILQGRILEQLPLTSLKGVGPSIEKKLHNIGIRSIQDLLFHLPLRYQDRTRISPIGSVRLGDNVLLQGEITGNRIDFGRRRSLLCGLADASGLISLRFYYFTAAQKNNLQCGQKVRCYGEVRRGKSGFEIYHPEYHLINDANPVPVEENLTPIYPATEGLQQNRLRNIIGQALKLLDGSNEVVDYLPQTITSALGLESLTEAVRLLHLPPTETALDWISHGIHPAQKRLSFEELLAHRLCMRRLRLKSDHQQAPPLLAGHDLCQQFIAHLPFKLTAAQLAAFEEISSGLKNTHPMLRLLQGDVGSGKTVVAALSSLQAIGNGHQVALMVPTEILSEQHVLTFSNWFEPLGLNVGWLSRRSRGATRTEQLAAMKNGDCDLTIGTHALFQEDVEFQKLGLIIIDEQHRFGVHQRLSLREKARQGLSPHQLVMTATPIPRTLAMSAYADLDCSIISELPPGRTPVNTVVIPSERRNEVTARIEQACKDNNQAYWVCTLIDESEALQCQAAEATAEALGKQLPAVTIGLIHGRMKPEEKTRVMDNFKTGLLHLLVATTVIEVGVDVPSASLMVIENPERLGLAQLHQLRGRVGRGNKSSHCILLYQSPLSQTAKQRLGVMRDSNDGFYIAEKDLEFRGPGQVLGTQQAGLMSFKVAELSRDANLLDEVKSASALILTQHPEIVDALIHRWLGDKQHFAQV
jgi:ATP-dependent DNA helicase RecG